MWRPVSATERHRMRRTSRRRQATALQCSPAASSTRASPIPLVQLFCVQYNMAPFLMEDLIAPPLAEYLDEIVSAQVSRELHSKPRPHHVRGGGELLASALAYQNRR